MVFVRFWVVVGLSCLCANAAHASEIGFELQAQSDGSYAHPHDIVLDAAGSLLYVADLGNNRVAVLDAESLVEVASLAANEISQPHDVVFDQQGRLLVADTGNNRIAIFEVNNEAARLVDSLSERISRPEGVAVLPDGRVLATGAGSNNLVVYDEGRVVAEVRGFSSPHDVELDAEGFVWVADANNDRMVKLNRDWEIVAVLAGPGYDFDGPRYMDFDQAGTMYVADKYTNSIKLINSAGKMVMVLGRDRAGLGAGGFDRPEGVEVRGGDVWFSDTYNDRIVRYRVLVAD